MHSACEAVLPQLGERTSRLTSSLLETWISEAKISGVGVLRMVDGRREVSVGASLMMNSSGSSSAVSALPKVRVESLQP